MPFYTEDKEVTLAHLAQAAKRLLSAKNTAGQVKSILEVSETVEQIETEAKPEAVKRESKP